MSNRRPPSAETIQSAEQRVREYLATVAVRSNEAQKPRSKRKGFGRSIALPARSPETDALFFEIGFPYPSGRYVALEHFKNQSDYEQDRILRQLVNHAQTDARIWDATMDLYDELATGSSPKRATQSMLFASFRAKPRPNESLGPNDHARNALILNLLHILRAEFNLTVVQNSATKGDNDACGIVVRVINEEWQKDEKAEDSTYLMNVSRDTVRNVWERHRTLARKMAENDARIRAEIAAGRPETEG